MTTGFERYTDRARRSIELASRQAHELNHPYIGSEHLLLGILEEGEGPGFQLLDRLGLSFEEVKAEVIATWTFDGQAPAHLRFSAPLREILEAAITVDDARHRGFVGQEHLVLAMFHVGVCKAGQIFTAHEINEGQARASLRLLEQIWEEAAGA